MKNSVKTIKALALIFAVVLFVGFISLPVYSIEAPVQLTVSSASGKAGDEVTVSINISPNSKLGAATILFKYDASKLDYKSDETGNAGSNGMAVFNADFKTEGSLKTMKAAYINVNGLTAGGSLFDITFTIKSGWSGESPLILVVEEFINPTDYKTIANTVTNGSIAIGASATTTVPTKPGETAATTPVTSTTTTPTTTKPATTKPTTTRVEKVTDKDGSKVTEMDKDGSTVYKTTVIYETVTRTEYVTEEGGSIVFETDEAGSTVYKTTVVYERVAGTEYVTDVDGSKVFVTDESGSTVYETTMIYETVDGSDLQGETDEKGNTVIILAIIALVCLILAAAVLIAYKKKKDTAK